MSCAPVHTAVGSRRPSNGACGRGDQRFWTGSYARPCGGTTGLPAPAVWLPPHSRSVVPVQATALAARPDSIAGNDRHRFVNGLYAKPVVESGAGFPPRGAPAPPTTSSSCPSHVTVAPPRGSGSGAIRRHASVVGSYAAARAKCAGQRFPSGPTSPTRTMSSFPSHAPTGDCDGASGDVASLRQEFVAGLYAAPSENASPRQQPPQPR